MSRNYSSDHASPLHDENRNPLCWSLIEGKGGEDRTNETIRSCFLGKVFLPFESRNAWNDTRHQSYHPIHPTLVSAKEYFYGRGFGGRGTSTFIVEKPAIVVAGEQNAVILTQGANSALFSSCAEDTLENMSILGVLASFASPRIWCALTEAAPAGLPFKRWRCGKDSAWSDEVIRTDLTYSCDLIKRITLRIQEAGIVPDT